MSKEMNEKKEFNIAEMKSIYDDALKFYKDLILKSERVKELSDKEKKKIAAYCEILKYIKTLYAIRMVEDVAIKSEAEFQKKTMAANDGLRNEIAELQSRIEEHEKSLDGINKSEALEKKGNAATKEKAIKSFSSKITSLEEEIRKLEGKIAENDILLSGYVKGFVKSVMSKFDAPGPLLSNIFNTAISRMYESRDILPESLRQNLVNDQGVIDRGRVDFILSYLTNGDVKSIHIDTLCAEQKKRMCKHFKDTFVNLSDGYVNNGLGKSVPSFLEDRSQLEQEYRDLVEKEAEFNRKNSGFLSAFRKKDNSGLVSERIKLDKENMLQQREINMYVSLYFMNLANCFSSVSVKGMTFMDSAHYTYEEKCDDISREDFVQMEVFKKLAAKIGVDVNDIYDIIYLNPQQREEKLKDIGDKIFGFLSNAMLERSKGNGEDISFIIDAVDREEKVADEIINDGKKEILSKYGDFSVGRSDSDLLIVREFFYRRGGREKPENYIGMLEFLTIVDDYNKLNGKDKVTELQKVIESDELISQAEVEAKLSAFLNDDYGNHLHTEGKKR